MASFGLNGPVWPPSIPGLHGLVRPPRPCLASAAPFSPNGLISASLTLSWPPRLHLASKVSFDLNGHVWLQQPHLASTTSFPASTASFGPHGLIQPRQLSTPQRLPCHFKFNHWKKSNSTSLQSKSNLHFPLGIRVSEDWRAIVLPKNNVLSPLHNQAHTGPLEEAHTGP